MNKEEKTGFMIFLTTIIVVIVVLVIAYYTLKPKVTPHNLTKEINYFERDFRILFCETEGRTAYVNTKVNSKKVIFDKNEDNIEINYLQDYYQNGGGLYWQGCRYSIFKIKNVKNLSEENFEISFEAKGRFSFIPFIDKFRIYKANLIYEYNESSNNWELKN